MAESADGPSADRAADGPRQSRRGSTLVGAGILLSRVTGLARERALSHYLGTSFVADAFTAAFRIPNLLQHLLGEGVLSASFIPVYSRLLAEGREDEAGRVAGAIAGLLAVATGALALVGILFAEPLTLVVAAGFSARERTFALTVTLVRILFPGVGFLVLSAWCLGVLNSHRRFFLSYVAPVMLNIVQIGVLVGAGGVLLATELAGDNPGSAQARLATWLAVGTVAGGLLQFLVQLPAALKLNPRLRPSLQTDLPGVRTTLRSFAPVVSARGVLQLSSYVQVFLASFLASGALASLRYAQILYFLPVSLFGMSVAAAELPELSRGVPAPPSDARTRLQDALARIATFVVPTTIGYLLIGDFVVGILFQTGAFGRLDTVAVWIVLAGYAAGLLASTSTRVLQSALYGAGDAQTPARVAVVRVGCSVLLGVALMLQFDRVAVTPDGIRVVGSLPALSPLPDAVREAAATPDVVHLGAAGLSVAAGIASWLEYLLLRRSARRLVGRTTLAGGQLRPVAVAAGVAGVAALAVRPFAGGLPPVIGGLVAVGVTGVVYAGVAAALGAAEIRALLTAVSHRLRSERR